MKKIGLINQRYGLEVNGGSEYYTRLIAEHFKDKYDVEVLTTTAIDNISWKNDYPAGITEVNGIRVRRFPVDHEKNESALNEINRKIFENPRKATREQEWKWIEEQGPLAKELVRYIAEHHKEYDAFIVVTYLYYPQIKSLPYIGGKTIFIPTAHEEPFIHFGIFKGVFTLPKAFIFLTEEERTLVQSLFSVKNIRNDILGVGVEVPENVNGEVFKKKHQQDDYIIYVGRIEGGKGFPELFDYFIQYKKRNHNSIKLVLMGKSSIPVPRHPDIVSLGFVSEEDKFNGIAGAKALVQPSLYESLSIVLLEAMSLSIPVIVNAKCDVLRCHCNKSNAGLYYANFAEFEGALNHMLWYENVYSQMKDNAYQYVRQHYQWQTILARFEDMIEYVTEK